MALAVDAMVVEPGLAPMQMPLPSQLRAEEEEEATRTARAKHLGLLDIHLGSGCFPNFQHCSLTCTLHGCPGSNSTSLCELWTSCHWSCGLSHL